MQSLKKSCKKAAVVSQYGWSPHLTEISNSIHSFLAGQGMSQEILIIFCYYCLFKEQWYHNSFSWHHAPNANLWQLQRKDFHTVHVVFWHSIFYCFDYYISTQVKPCFICKNQVVQHINPFLWKIHGVDYRISTQLVKS